MRISAAIIDELVLHARAAAPEECCGLIGCQDGAAAVLVPCVNDAPLRALSYEISGPDQYAAMARIEQAGLELGGIYHSHPFSAPYPSQTDIELAFYPQLSYVIVGLEDSDWPQVRAFEISAGEVRELDLAG